jgi:hypothetical protein
MAGHMDRERKRCKVRNSFWPYRLADGAFVPGGRIQPLHDQRTNQPLQATANLTGMYFLPHFVHYGVVSAEDKAISQSASAYVQHITAPQAHRYRMAP